MASNYMKDFNFSKLEHYVKGGAIKPSPDQYVGTLIVTDKVFNFTQYERDTIEYEDGLYYFRSGNKYDENNVLVVLESPHRFEYDVHHQPIGLAMGKTGDNFFRLFTHALNQSAMVIRNGIYNVILSNAVQYQTSCGLNPIDRHRRDLNWLDIYNNQGGEEDFIKRIFTIKPKYTFNLCTGGRNPNGLRSLVNKTLDEIGLKKGRHYAEGNHPASWDYHGNIVNAKIY